MLNLNIVKHNNIDMMSSLDLADLCIGKDKFDHKNFMAKAKIVLGEGVVKFYHTYIHPQNKQTYTCLMLPEREACLMAMSYSYELQAKVYDAWKVSTVSHKPEAVLRAEEYQAIHILLNEYDPEWVRQERDRLLPQSNVAAIPPPPQRETVYNSEMQCPVVRFLNSHMKMGGGLSITSHDLFWAINDHYDFFTSQNKITRIVKLLHLKGVEYGQVRSETKGYQRGFKGLGLL